MLKLLSVVPVLILLGCGGAQQAASQAAPPTTVAQASTDTIRAALDGKPVANLLSQGLVMVALSTPYSRIANAAHAAKATYTSITEADVVDEAVPEVKIDPMDVRVVAVVVASSAGGDVVRPMRTERTDRGGIVAVFPLSVLTDGNEIRVVYPEPNRLCQREGPAPGTAECVVPIDMSKIR